MGHSGVDMTVVDGRLTSNPINPSSGIVFNNQQLAALEDVERWYSTGRQDPYILQGYAGTGKTTLVREMLTRLKIPLSRIALAAPTNRAAKVLGNKTGLHTMTVHKLIYLTVREELDYQQELLYTWKKANNFTDLADLIIISNETDLAELYAEEMGQRMPDDEADYESWLDGHRRMVLMHEGVVLPDDAAERLAYFDKVKSEKMRFHKEEIIKLTNEDLKSRPKEASEIIARYSLIIVDEASMVHEQMGKDLVNYGVPVILVGDPFQLPPVKANAYWHNRKAQTVLTRIERQKGVGAGIPLAGEKIREGYDVSPNESLSLHRRGSLPNDEFVLADQIIAGTHKSRERICRIIRKLKGFTSPHPHVGEKIVANYNDKMAGIMNGEIYVVEKSEISRDGETVMLNLRDPFGKVIKDIKAWVAGFAGRDFTNELPAWHGKFWWGYCITCHQSQGSEWKNIIVCNDWPSRGNDGDRWLYTAITRASEHCSLIMNFS